MIISCVLAYCLYFVDTSILVVIAEACYAYKDILTTVYSPTKMNNGFL